MAFAEFASALGYGQAILLGLVQGLAEFLPISSSGHLALIGHVHGLVGGEADGLQSLQFDLLLHLATVLVVVAVFARDLIQDFRRHPALAVWLVIGCLPAGLVGLTLREQVEYLRAIPEAVCACLMFTGLLLWQCERRTPKEGQEGLRMEETGAVRSLLIGIGQGLAILPGISRSGATIATGLMLGLERETAVRFSFLLMLPVVLGACLLELLRDPGAILAIPVGPAVLGFLAAVLSGLLSLLALIRLVRARRLIWFAAYCGCVGFGGLLLFTLLRMNG